MNVEQIKRVLMDHFVQCTGPGEVACGHEECDGWMGWGKFYQHQAEAIIDYQDHRRGGSPADPQPHGTNAAIRRHERHAEPLCEACRLERNRLARQYHAARAVRPTGGFRFP